MGKAWFKWVLLGVGVYINTFVVAMMFSFGSLLNAMLDKFNQNTTMTASVQAIFVGVALSTGLFSGIAISRLGKWKTSLVGAILCPLGFILSFPATSLVHLYASIGVISGLGVSLLFISSTTVIGKTFLGAQRLLVLAIQNAGISVGVALLPYLLNFLLKTYGLNGSFLVIGGFYLNLIPCARLFVFADKQITNDIRNDTTELDVTKSSSTSYGAISNGATSVAVQLDIPKTFSILNCMTILKEEMLRLRKDFRKVMNVPFFLSAIGIGIVIASLNGYFGLVMDILIWKGFTPSQALIAFPITYGIGFVGRILPGIMKQVKGVNSLVLQIVFSLCGFLSQLIICYSGKPSVILVGCALSGVTIAGVMSAGNIIVVEVLEQEVIATGFGLVYTSIGVLTAICGPSYGAIKDIFQSYDIVLYLTSAFQLLGTFLFLLTLLVRRRQSKLPPSTLNGMDNVAHIPEVLG